MTASALHVHVCFRIKVLRVTPYPYVRKLCEMQARLDKSQGVCFVVFASLHRKDSRVDANVLDKLKAVPDICWEIMTTKITPLM